MPTPRCSGGETRGRASAGRSGAPGERLTHARRRPGSGRRPIASTIVGRVNELDETLPADAPRVAPSERNDELGRGDLVGRYIVLETLGRGGMGAVYAAYDPQLDRKIALKVLRDGVGEDAASRERLQREGQALARLRHRNVVTIHDVGTHARGLWIAMELIDGRTWRTWIDEQRREWREVARHALDIARGLAAAHEAGLVHRDVKPDNVMVARDGRVVVTDFGLVLPTDATAQPRLTQSGSVAGTPAFMAPEQILGQGVGPASDQFSFAVLLWQALYGVRPFGGTTLLEVVEGTLEGHLVEPPAGREVPVGLRRILARALSRAIEDRHPSMLALVLAIERELGRRRRRPLGIAAVAALVVGGTVAGRVAIAAHREREACRASAEAIADVWNEATAEDLGARVVATGVSHAAASWDLAVPRVDAWVGSWREARLVLCDGGGPSERRAAAFACLDDRRAELVSLVDMITRTDAVVVHRLNAVVAALSPISDCEDEAELSRAYASDDRDRLAQTAELRAEIRRARGLVSGGRVDAARAEASQLRGRIDAAGNPRLRAEMLRLESSIDRTAGAFDAATTSARAAFSSAIEAGIDDLAADAAIDLVLLVGYHQGRPDEGSLWGAVAGALVERLGEAAALRGADLDNHLGLVAIQRSPATAREHFGRATEIRGEALGTAHPAYAAALDNLAGAERALGRHEQALALRQRALGIFESVYGPQHPHTALSLAHTGETLKLLGRDAEALAALERALELLRAAFGDEHEQVAKTLIWLADATSGRDRDAAAAHLVRAVAILRATLGEDHPNVAVALNNLGNLQRSMGALDEARASHLGALQIRERIFGHEHPLIGSSLANLAEVERAAGNRDEARRRFEAAAATWRSGPGADPAQLVRAYAGLVALDLDEGAVERAKATLELARQLCQREATPCSQSAELDALAVRVAGLGHRPRDEGPR
jgi:tetratricopeptide (TPR) repeat protein